jgi:hypothetical protein
MEPITLITSALALGVAAGAKPTAEQVIKDTYLALKTLIQNKYQISVAQLEEKPESKSRINVIAEELIEAKADRDEELIKRAKEFMDLMEKLDNNIDSDNKFNLILKNCQNINIFHGDKTKVGGINFGGDNSKKKS